MKKTLFTTVVIFLFISFVSAQSTRYGFSFGATYANMTEKTGGTTTNGSYKFGATFGIVVDVPMQKGGSFQTGVNFTQKGTKDQASFLGASGTVTNVLNYIEVPMNVVFKFKSSGGKFLAGAGISGSLGFFGKSTNTKNGIETVSYLNFGNNSGDNLKGIDFGINGLVGYEFKNNWSVAAGYYRGIINVISGGTAIDKLTNNFFSLRFGYFLKEKMSKGKKPKGKK
ncbi:MAG: porin family protein [Chitinophagales bacterium]